MTTNDVTLQTVEAARDAYAELLLEEDRLNEEYKTALASFEERNADLIARRKEARDAREKQETFLRESAIALYLATPDGERKKAITPGVDIEDRTRVDLPAPAELVPLLIQHAPFLLLPDEKAIRDLGEAVMAGKKHLLRAFGDFLGAIKVYREPVAAVGGVKTMGGVLQMNAAKQFMQNVGEATTPAVEPVSTPKPSKQRKHEPFALEDDAPVVAAVSALEAAAEAVSQ